MFDPWPVGEGTRMAIRPNSKITLWWLTSYGSSSRQIRSRNLANRPSSHSCSFYEYVPKLCGFDGRVILPDWRNFRRAGRNVLVGARGVTGSNLLLAKFAWRGDMERGCILRRPCLCSDILPTARELCAVRRIWPRISSRMRKNDFIYFPIVLR